MHSLTLTPVTILLTFLMGQGPLTQPKKALPDKWIQIESKIGATLLTPPELGVPSSKPLGLKRPASESYSPKGWPGCKLLVCRRPFGKEESPDDSVATKLEDVVLSQITPEEDSITNIKYLAMSGWPAIEIEGKRGDDSLFRCRVCRTKSCDYEVLLTGTPFPDKEILNRVFDSVRLPKDVTAGKLAHWGPDPQVATIGNAHTTVWSPVPLKDSDDVPDFNREDVTPIGYAGEFGYVSVSITYVELPGTLEDTYDEDAIDKLIALKYGKNDDGDAVKFGDFKSYKSNGDDFRTVTFVDDSIEGRVDVVVKDKNLYMFSVSVPKGMIDSSDVKHFFTSITFKGKKASN